MSINTTPAPEMASSNTMAGKTKPLDRVVVTQLVEEKSVHTPVSAKKFPWKQVQTHRTSGVKVHPVVIAERHDRLMQQNEELMRAISLRRIKRRLFLEAVNSDHPRISHHNLVRLEVTGKKNRMGSG
jgi:hypothetical protein